MFPKMPPKTFPKMFPKMSPKMPTSRASAGAPSPGAPLVGASAVVVPCLPCTRTAGPAPVPMGVATAMAMAILPPGETEPAPVLVASAFP